MKQFNQGTRYKIFTVVRALLRTNIAYLKTVSSTFIETYVHLTTGEKDPRNLMESFEIAAIILKSFDIGKYSEELFDVTFCYFPITFEPPKNDPYGITSDKLRQALRACISANGIFAKDSFSGLLEKLTSSSMKVKNETLVTISECVQNYEPDYVGTQWKEIWDGLKFEIIHGSEEGAPETTLAILRGLASSLEKASDQSLFESYLESVVTETKENIAEVQNKKALPSIRLAAGIAGSSPTVFGKIANTILTTVLNATSGSPNIAAQRIILDMIGYFVKSSKSTGENVLEPYKDRIIEFYSKSLMGSSKVELTLRTSAVKHLSEIASIKGFLTNEEIGLITQYFDDVVLDDNQQELKDVALDALIAISSTHVDLILTITFPAFLAQLPDTETADNKEDIERILYALAKVSVNRSTFESLSVRLLSKLTTALRGNCSPHYPQAIFTTLLSVVIKMSDDPEEDISIYLVRLLPEIFTKYVENFKDEHSGSVLYAHQVIHPVGILITLVVRAADATKQTQFVENLIKTFWLSEPSKLVTSKFFKAASFKPLTRESEPSNVIALFTAALAPIKKEIDLGLDPIQLIANAISIVSASSDPAQRLNYLRLIALVTNKWVPTKSEPMKTLCDDLYANILESEKSQNIKKSLNALEVFTWISKAYLLKTDAYGYDLLNKLVALLANPKIGPFASKTMDILGDDDLVLSKENGVLIRLLAKQRLFSTALSPLVSKFKESSSSPETQACYLVALSGILRHMPPKVISTDAPVFFPLLLQSISIKDPRVREASILTIAATLHESSAVVAEHISSLVPQLLAATSERESPSTKVRLAALHCLGEFPKSIERKNLEPFRILIIKGLNVPLDDRRRDVRRAAVNARQKYFELNSAPDE